MTQPIELKVVDRGENQQSMLELIDEIRADIVAGNITRVGVVFCKVNSEWGTTFSKSDNRCVDAAMLIELGLRRLGFKN